MKTLSGMSLNNLLKCEEIMCFFYDRVWAYTGFDVNSRQRISGERRVCEL